MKTSVACRLAGLAILSFNGLHSANDPQTWYTGPLGNDALGDGSQSNPWQTLGHAINHVQAGDTIRLLSDDNTEQDDFVENIVLNKTLTLEALEDQPHRPVLRSANPNNHAITVTADAVTIRGLDIYGAASNDRWVGAICLQSVTGCTVEDNRCGWEEAFANMSGIYLEGADDNTLTGNICSNNKYGIYLVSGSGHNRIADNTCSYNGYGNVVVDGGSSNTLENNMFEQGRGVYLTAATRDCELIGNTCRECGSFGMDLRGSGHVVRNNNCTGSSFGLYVPSLTTAFLLQDNTCNGNRNDGINIGGNGHTLSGNTCNENEKNGIFHWGSEAELDANSCRYNGNSGILVRIGEQNELTNNVCNDNITGIYLEETDGNTLSGNTCSDNNHQGIHLGFSDANQITGNTCVNNDKTAYLFKTANIYLEGSCNNLLSGNTCSISQSGIYVDLSSNDNTITGNTLSNQLTGVYIFDSSGNLLSQNQCPDNDYGGIQLNKAVGNTITQNSISSLDFLSGSHGNTATDNDIGDGYTLIDESDNNQLSGNSMAKLTLRDSTASQCEDNQINGDGVIMDTKTQAHWDHDFSGNTREGKPIVFWNGVANATVPEGAAQVILTNCSNITVRDQTLSQVYNGLQMGYCTGCTIQDNQCSANGYYGILVQGCTECQISGNSCVGSGSTGIWLVESENNTLSGNICNEAYYAGIQLERSHGNTLDGNTCKDTRMEGIRLMVANNNTLLQNLCQGNRSGINITRSTGISLQGNSTLSNTESGITLAGSESCTLLDNQMNGDGLLVGGDTLNHWNTHTIDTSNSVSGKPLYYWKNRQDGTIPAGAGQVILANCQNVVIEGQDLSHGSFGIILGASSGNRIRNNTCSGNNRTGIAIDYASNGNTIADNQCHENAQHGVFIHQSTENVLTGNSFSQNNGDGILLIDSPENILTGNTIRQNLENGIRFSESPTQTVSRNTLADNQNSAICIFGSPSITALENTMTDNGFYIYGWEEPHWNTHNIDTSNTVNGRPVYYWNDQHDAVLPPGAGQILLSACTQVTVQYQDLSHASIGIGMGYCSQCSLYGNNCIGNTIGIDLNFMCSENTISANTCSGGKTGIKTWTAWFNTFENNVCDQNSSYGAYLNSANNDYIDNTFNGNGIGLFLYTESSSAFKNNEISDNTTEGLKLDYAGENEFYGNIISGNQTGMSIVGSDDNRIFHNTFQQNETTHISGYGDHFLFSPNSRTYAWKGSWQSAPMGNYYDDYAGTDSDGDGIGDTATPYLISGFTDPYPLMAPASNYVPYGTPYTMTLAFDTLLPSGQCSYSFERCPWLEHYRVEYSTNLQEWQTLTEIDVTQPEGRFEGLSLTTDSTPVFYRVVTR